MSSNLSISSSLPGSASISLAKSPEKIASSAKEFESMLIGQWLQAAETSFGSVPGAEDDQEDGGDQMKSFGIQHLATALTNAGGIGIASMIASAFRHSGETLQPMRDTDQDAGSK